MSSYSDPELYPYMTATIFPLRRAERCVGNTAAGTAFRNPKRGSPVARAAGFFALWFPLMDSNHDWRSQSAQSYRLDEAGMVEAEGVEPSTFCSGGTDLQSVATPPSLPRFREFGPFGQIRTDTVHPLKVTPPADWATKGIGAPRGIRTHTTCGLNA